MPRPSSRSRQYLEEHRGRWRVTIGVPRDLQAKLGTKLKRALNTDSLAIANQLKWQVVTELKAEIDAARGGPGSVPSPADALLREALAIKAQLDRAQTNEEHDAIEAAIEARVDDIMGLPVAVTQFRDEDVEPVYAPGREAQAAGFRALAMGKATPIALHHAEFLAHSGNKPRTQGDDKRALKFLLAWCEANRITPTIEAITRKHVVRFVQELPELAGVQSPVTLKKYLSRLSLFWRFLMAREITDSDPWHQSNKLLPAPPKGPEERSFSDDEVAKLLAGPASQQLHDLMRIGALTGARLDVIVDLKVKDCVNGRFVFKPQKKEKSERAVPMHPALADIIARRTEGKGPGDDVFPEYPVPVNNPERERSFKASGDFTLYRRKVGVDEVVPGKRRSLVNFHSFRRWFITKAEQAGQAEHIIAVVVGHKREGMTLGRYSAGPKFSQAQACVEAVMLPT